jgi:hypothetical protein
MHDAQGPAELQASQDMTVEPQQMVQPSTSASTRPDVRHMNDGYLLQLISFCIC